MYAVLPFTIFLAPPLVGFLADKMGSYTRALILTLIGSGIFHTVLLFLPKVTEVEIMPSSTLFTFEGKFTNFWGEIFVIDIFFRDFGSFINLFASSPWAKSFSPLRFYVRTCSQPWNQCIQNVSWNFKLGTLKISETK